MFTGPGEVDPRVREVLSRARSRADNDERDSAPAAVPTALPQPPRWRLPASVSTALLSVRGRAVAGATLVLLVAVLVLAARVTLARRATQVPGLPVTVTPVAGDRLEPAGAPGSPTVSSSGTRLVVSVVGLVRRPGLYRLPSGFRIDDALRAAGGPKRHADTLSLNLAAPLSDGQQVVVSLAASGTPAPANRAVPGGAPGSSPGGSSLDLNTADAAALEGLPGVGPVLAERIIAYRTQHGRFGSVEQLNDVSGIGEKIFAQLAPLVRAD